MAQSELNKQLLEAINYRKMRNIDRENFQSYNAKEIENVADECEKICLKYSIQSQIDLLNEVGNTISTQSLTAHTLRYLSELKNEKQEQLNNLK